MLLESLPTEIILSQSCKTLDRVCLDWNPQPGAYLQLSGQTYTVLERRHRYHLQGGRYQLHRVVLYVQATQPPSETSVVNGRRVLGEASCRFNAHSELMRCAIHPIGPCHSCRFYEPRSLD